MFQKNCEHINYAYWRMKIITYRGPEQIGEVNILQHIPSEIIDIELLIAASIKYPFVLQYIIDNNTSENIYVCMINSIFTFGYKKYIHEFAKKQIEYYYLFSEKCDLLDQILKNPKFYLYLESVIKIQQCFKKCYYYDTQYKKAKKFALEQIMKL